MSKLGQKYNKQGYILDRKRHKNAEKDAFYTWEQKDGQLKVSIELKPCNYESDALP